MSVLTEADKHTELSLDVTHHSREFERRRVLLAPDQVAFATPLVPPRFAHTALALLMILSRLNHVGRLSSAAPATIAWCVLDSFRTQAGLKLGVTEEQWVLLGLPVAVAHA